MAGLKLFCVWHLSQSELLWRPAEQQFYFVTFFYGHVNWPEFEPNWYGILVADANTTIREWESSDIQYIGQYSV